MKAVIKAVAAKIAVDIEEIDVDSSARMQEQFGNEVPVLFIDGRKAFKYRLTAASLEKRLRRDHWPLLGRWARITGRETS